MNNIYINIKDVAEAKGLKSTRSLRLELNKNESKYISREIKVNGGTSYEILFSSLEPELQDKLRINEKKSTALVPLNYQPPQFVSDQAKMTANFRLNIVLALIKFRRKYSIKKQADSDFLDLYNSGLYLPKAYKFIGSISLGTLHRWLRKHEKHENIKREDITLNTRMWIIDRIGNMWQLWMPQLVLNTQCSTDLFIDMMIRFGRAFTLRTVGGADAE